MFNMSIMGAVMGGVILLVRMIRKLPRRLAVVLWAIPFLRLAVPIGVGSPYSLMTLLSKITTKTVVLYQPAENVTLSMTNCIQLADSYFPVTYKMNRLDAVFSFAGVVWSIGAAAILLTLFTLYFTTMREIKGAVHLRENIYLSEKVTSPAVYGILKPRIVLPAKWQEQDAEFILLHEKMHIRRLDNLWRMMAFVITAVHWFNPFCWLFLKCFLADLELACDEQVMQKVGEEKAKEYALSLLESRQGKMVFASAFGGAKVRTRIEYILSFRRLSGLSLVVFSALVGVIFFVLMTNAG